MAHLRGVAILVRPTLCYERDRYIPQQGLNWAAIKIRLRKHPQHKHAKNLGNSLNIITSYTKHGNEYEALITFSQVQNYIEQYTCPYVWGGDYNRPPDTMVEESRNRFMAIRTHAPRAQSTCSVGGLIDYFVTHENEHQILEDISVIQDTVVTPHSPVAATIREDIYLTKALQQVTAPKWPQCDPVHEPLSWEESLNMLREDLRGKVHPKRYQDKMQEQYAQKIGVHTPGMQMSDVYSLWSATTTVQMLSAYTRDKQEIKKYLSLGQKARYWYAPREKKEKEDSHVDSDLGILIELHKQFVSMHKWEKRHTRRGLAADPTYRAYG